MKKGDVAGVIWQNQMVVSGNVAKSDAKEH